MKCATVIVSVDKDGNDWSILDIKGHENPTEAKAFVFDEICRHCDDCSENNECNVKFFKDTYRELCVEIVSDDARTILKTTFEEDGGENDNI